MPKKPTPPPDKAEPDPGPKTFIEEVRAIVEQASFAYEEEAPQWPITRPRGAYSEVWVSEFMKKLERVFDPDIHTCRPHPENIPDGEAQRIHDERIMATQRKMANRLWREDPETATRIVDILRNTKKPLGIPDVDSRVAFLREIDRLAEVKALAKSRRPSTPSQAEYPRRIGRLEITDASWSNLKIARRGHFHIRRPKAIAVIKAMVRLHAFSPETARQHSRIKNMAGVASIQGAFSDRGDPDDVHAKRCRELAQILIVYDRTRRGYYLDVYGRRESV